MHVIMKSRFKIIVILLLKFMMNKVSNDVIFQGKFSDRVNSWLILNGA